MTKHCHKPFNSQPIPFDDEQTLTTNALEGSKDGQLSKLNISGWFIARSDQFVYVF